MYHFLDLDEETRLNMLSELEFDICTGLFYEPLSMTTSGMMNYKRLLKECFEKGTPETLQQKLTSSFFRETDRNGRKFRLTFVKWLPFLTLTAIMFGLYSYVR